MYFFRKRDNSKNIKSLRESAKMINTSLRLNSWGDPIQNKTTNGKADPSRYIIQIWTVFTYSGRVEPLQTQF